MDSQKDLLVQKQKEILNKMICELKKSDHQLYYSSASEISHILYEKIQEEEGMALDLKEFVIGLAPRDIQILCSLN